MRESERVSRIRLAGLLLLPAVLLLRWLAFRYPELTERWYGGVVYPLIGRSLGAVAGLLSVSVAEIAASGLLAILGWVSWRRLMAWRRGEGLGSAMVLAARVWLLAGVVFAAFMLLWGTNYARPGLASRLQLDEADIGAAEVLHLGVMAAEQAVSLHRALGLPTDEPSHLGLDFAQLNRSIDRSLTRLALPGDGIEHGAPAKRLWSSGLLSRLGISGIFIPFTGEPSVNGMVPDVSLPVVVAHEKAHQRGIANEGEANLAAVLACVGADAGYVRYSGYLYVAAHAISAAYRALPERAAAAWDSLGSGPLHDLQAERDFWARYEGPARRAATQVNDAYLRSNRVPGGVESYGQVVRLLVGAQRARLLPLLDAGPRPQE